MKVAVHHGTSNGAYQPCIIYVLLLIIWIQGALQAPDPQRSGGTSQVANIDFDSPPDAEDETGSPHLTWAEYNPFSCQDRKPGYYADYTKACQIYYVCVANDARTFSFQCGEGTVFDDKIRNCNWPQNVPC